MSNTDTLESNRSSQPVQGTIDSSNSALLKRIKTSVVFVHDHLFSISIIAILLFGWSRRDDNYLSAESGAGYILGIVGGSLMLLLVLYPIGKRSASFARLIPMRFWFWLHMILGIVGPVMILFHANFHLGSLNSSVALISMLLVAGSGLFGRYFYTHIHHGLYGQRITFQELRQEAETKYSELALIYEMDEKVNRRRSVMEERALQNYTGLAVTLLHSISLAVDSRLLHSRIKRLLKSPDTHGALKTDPRKNTLTIEFVERYTSALRKIVAFRVFERLFSLWHILHLPLFIMMIITAIVHIFAVHMY